MTVNELLVLIKEVRGRVCDLKSLRNSVSVKETRFYGDTQRTETAPQYDIKAVDKKISTLQTWLFKADSAIKQSNATTQVKVETNVDELLESL